MKVQILMGTLADSSFNVRDIRICIRMYISLAADPENVCFSVSLNVRATDVFEHFKCF